MNSKSRFTSLRFALLASLLSSLPSPTFATGDWNSINLLEDHKFAAIASPEFWFELEMKEMARGLKVKEKHVSEPDLVAEAEEPPADPAAPPSDQNPSAAAKKPARNPADKLDTEEGLLYEKGADAYHGGKWADAEAAWKELLALPEEKRKQRSVWAEYMLGRTAIEAGQLDQAQAHFAKAREFAAAGFGDPHGLAAASYGWEAYAWKESDPEKAVALYLRQLATGDDRAVTSIKFVIRSLWFPELDYNAEPDAKKPAQPGNWEKAAKSSVLRPVITRWYLAMSADVHNRWREEYPGEPDKGPENWLALVEKAGAVAEEADRVAWLAYRSGKYDVAQRWLKLVAQETRMSLWLTAKLALRSGDSAKAAVAMEKAAALFPAPEQLAVSNINMQMSLPKAAAAADRAAVLLTQNKFAEALTAFIEAGYWQDAAYIAERVLTLDELKDFVDKNYAKPAQREEASVDRDTLDIVVVIPNVEKPQEEEKTPETNAGGAPPPHEPSVLLETPVIHGELPPDAPQYKDAVAWRIRWLLGRRMVREDREADARPYLPRDVQPVLDAYTAALAKAADKKSSKADQAKNWWIAAWIARYAGMELMGTELGPDNCWQGGSFEGFSIATARRTGMEPDPAAVDFENTDVTRPIKTRKIQFGVAPTVEEKKRLAKSVLPREYRYHYRWVAASLAKKAAALLADGTEEKADVLNEAGTWLFDRDVKGEEAFFDEIKRTCPNTKIGKAVLAKKHTFPQSGPWSGKGLEEGK